MTVGSPSCAFIVCRADILSQTTIEVLMVLRRGVIAKIRPSSGQSLRTVRISTFLNRSDGLPR